MQKQPWRLCYARDKAQPPPSAAATAGADALQVQLLSTDLPEALPVIADYGL